MPAPEEFDGQPIARTLVGCYLGNDWTKAFEMSAHNEKKGKMLGTQLSTSVYFGLLIFCADGRIVR
jgi:hypothetical protein